jgi:hypothetical protein
MKPSEQWMRFADLLEERVRRVREQSPLSMPSLMMQVAIALIGVSADATIVAKELEKKGQ